jgi:hypothetical protein
MPPQPQDPYPPRPINAMPQYDPYNGLPGQAPVFPDVPPKRKSGRKLAGLLVVLLVVIAAGGGAYAMVQQAKPTPDKVFQKALSVSMSTNSMSENIKSNTANVDYKFEFSDVSKPKVSAKGTTSVYDSISLTVEGYDDAVSSYARTSYKSSSAGTTKDDGQPFDSGWIQIRQDGKLPETYTDSGNYLRGILDTVADGHIGTNGDFINGNFSPVDRQKFINTINTNRIYAYDVAKVTKETLDGRAVFKYPVKVNAKALEELNKQVAKVTGADSGFLEAVRSSTAQVLDSTMYVAIDDGHLLKVVTTDGSQTATVTYSGFETTSIGRAPKPTSKWGQADDPLDSLSKQSTVN